MCEIIYALHLCYLGTASTDRVRTYRPSIFCTSQYTTASIPVLGGISRTPPPLQHRSFSGRVSHNLHISLADFLIAPGTGSHSALAGTASLPISASDDPSSPSPGNISNNREASHNLAGGIPGVIVQLEDLHNDGNNIPLRFLLYLQSRLFRQPRIVAHCPQG